MKVSKTPCGMHRVVGYSYKWTDVGSVLVCRACGLLDTSHETMRETVERLAAESTIDWEDGK